MDSWRRQIDRVFADIEEPTWTPAIELIDDGDNLILRSLLAGVNREDIDIQVSRDSVTIAGDRHRPESESSPH